MKAFFVSLIYLFVAAVFLTPTKSYAKGEGVGFWMEGTITEVTTEDAGRIRFKLRGKVWFEQYNGTSTTPQRIEVDCQKGAWVTVRQNDPFFAFTSDWRGGALSPDGALLRIVKAAAARKLTVKFELLKPALTFDGHNNLTVTDATVIRATDADLK